MLWVGWSRFFPIYISISLLSKLFGTVLKQGLSICPSSQFLDSHRNGKRNLLAGSFFLLFDSRSSLLVKIKWSVWITKSSRILLSRKYFPLVVCPVGRRIHWLHLCWGVRPPTSVLDMTLNNMLVRFQWCWSFGECGVPLYCQCSPVHSGPLW